MAKAMVWGRWIYAVGGKPEGGASRWASRSSGVLVSTYVISGLCAGIGAVVLAGRTEAGSPLYGNLLELDTIAAVIIGGASFLGGRGHIGHALVGAVMIGVIRNALNLLNVDVFFQMIAIGLIIVVAVEADVLRNHLEARARVLQAARSAMSAGAAPVLAVRHAQKRFGAVHALKDVSLEAYRGEVLALLGDNGAGKSTLVKCISGVHALDEGEILLDGEPASLHSPGGRAPRRHRDRLPGPRAVRQSDAGAELLLRPRDRLPVLAAARPALPQRARDGPRGRRGLDRLKVKLPKFDAPVALMSGGQRQAIAVARATVFARKVVILDEPTAALGVRESRKVLDLIAQLRAEGNAVILITHNMEHVVELADRAVVLRQGRKVGELKPEPRQPAGAGLA